MSEKHFDEYEHFNYDQEKYMHGRSGKQRTKKEAEQHTSRFDPSGNVRKVVQVMQNSEQNARQRTISSGKESEKKRKDEEEQSSDHKRCGHWITEIIVKSCREFDVKTEEQA
ncbi:unnamed protein product [Notodromas monacha]|uniref:Nuclear protein 1 n=1 Tax=Notodromas monacha TaxID=399045 RepID=A0A7R9GHW1_9CRUS|nr:unnamed protein product [Notodromas monacha]CAG0921199.1 unnamed protein product [Notodromas monacha]